MDSNILLQTAMPRSTNRTSLIKSIAPQYGSQPSHIRNLALAQSRISKLQDIAFGYPYRLSISYLALNNIDFKLNTIRDGGGDDNEGRNDGEDDDDDDDDEDEELESIPIIPTKIDLLLGQLTILDTNPILTDNLTDQALPVLQFPNQEFDKWTKSEKVIDAIRNQPSLLPSQTTTTTTISTPPGPQSPINLNQLPSTTDQSQTSFFNFTPLNPLRTINRNSHVIHNYKTLYHHDTSIENGLKNGQELQRFKFCDENLSFTDILGVITACFGPSLFLLAIHHICHLIISEPDEFEKLAYHFDQKTRIYTLFPTKIHMIAYLQVFLAPYTEFIPYSTNRDEALFLASQIPPLLIAADGDNGPSENKFAQAASNNQQHKPAPSLTLYPTRINPEPSPMDMTAQRYQHHPTILDQLSSPASDVAVFRLMLRDYYQITLPTPNEKYKSAAKNASNSPRQQLELYSQIPNLSLNEEMFKETLSLFYTDYIFNPANPSTWLGSLTNTNIPPKIKDANTVSNVFPPSSSQSPYPLVPSVRQLGRSDEDLSGLSQCELWRVLHSIARQNCYRDSNKKDTTHVETQLTVYASWQHVQTQDQLLVYLQLIAFLTNQNEIFFTNANKLFSQFDQGKVPRSQLQTFFLLDPLPLSTTTPSQTTFYIKNDSYRSLIKEEINGDTQFRAVTKTLIVRRTPQKFTINNVIVSIDISNFIPNRYIYPTSLSPLSTTLLSTNLIQPRLVSQVFSSSLGRAPGPNGQPVPILFGQLHDLLHDNEPSTIYSLYELSLFGQSLLSNGIIPWLLQKLTQSDVKALQSATLSSATYTLLDQSKEPPTAPQTNVTPKKKTRSLGEPSTPTQNGMAPDHLLNRISTLNGPGRTLFDNIDPESLRSFLNDDDSVHQFINSLYCASIEYNVSLGLATVFSKPTLDKLENPIDLALISSIQQSPIAPTEQSQVQKLLFPQSSSIGSQFAVQTVTQKINTKSKLPAPMFIIHQLTPLLTIDVFPTQRETFTNRLLKLRVADLKQLMSPQAFMQWWNNFENNYITFLHDRRQYFWTKFLDGNYNTRKQTADATTRLIEIVGPKPPATWYTDIKGTAPPSGPIDDSQQPPNIAFNNYSQGKRADLLEKVNEIRKSNLSAANQTYKSYQSVCNSLYTGLINDTFLNVIDRHSLGDPGDEDYDNAQEYNESNREIRYQLSGYNFQQADIAYCLSAWFKYCGAYNKNPASLQAAHSFGLQASASRPSFRQSFGRRSIGPGAVFSPTLRTPGVGIDLSMVDEGEQAPFAFLLQRQKTMDLSPKNTSGKTSPFFGSRRIGTKQHQVNPALVGFTTPAKYRTQGPISWPESDESTTIDDNDDNDDEGDLDQMGQLEDDFRFDQLEDDEYNDGVFHPDLIGSEDGSIDAPLEAGLHNPLDTSLDGAELLNTTFSSIGKLDLDALPPLPLATNTSQLSNPILPIPQQSDESPTPFLDGNNQPTTSVRSPIDVTSLVQSANMDPSSDQSNNNVGTGQHGQISDEASPDGRAHPINLDTIPQVNVAVESALVQEESSVESQEPELYKQSDDETIVQATPSQPKPEEDSQLDPKPAEIPTDSKLTSTKLIKPKRLLPTTLFKKPLINPTFVILEDNPLIIYTTEQLAKLTNLQQQRYATRCRQCDSIYTLEVECMIDYSESSSSASDTEDGEVIDEEKKMSEGNLVTSVIDQVKAFVNKWTIQHNDVTKSLQVNTISTIQLESILDLDEADTQTVHAIKQAYNNEIQQLYNDSSTGVIDPETVAKLQSKYKLAKHVQLGIIKKYVKFDQRFIKIAQQFYPV